MPRNKRKAKKPPESVTEHLVPSGLCFLLQPGALKSWRMTSVPEGDRRVSSFFPGDPQEGDGKSDQSWLDTSVLGNPIRWLQRKPKRPNFCSLSKDGRHVGGSPWPQANSAEGWQASCKKPATKKAPDSTWGDKKSYLLSSFFTFLTEV